MDDTREQVSSVTHHSLESTDTSGFIRLPPSDRPLLPEDDNNLVMQILAFHLSHDGSTDLASHVHTIQTLASLDQFAPIIDNPALPCTNQFLSDYTRTSLLRSIVSKALCLPRHHRGDIATPTAVAKPALPTELADRVVDILRDSWLGIPYESAAPLLRRVWGASLDEVRRAGDFDTDYAGGKIWEEELQQWCCACGCGRDGRLKWDERRRRWRCGEYHSGWHGCPCMWEESDEDEDEDEGGNEGGDEDGSDDGGDDGDDV